MRIFLGPVEIAGYFSRLKRGFDRLGVPATYGVLRPHAFGYGIDEDALAAPVRWCRRVHARRTAARAGWERAWWTAAFALASALAFPWALFTHDVFIFGFGTSFFALRDLPVLKLFGKQVVFVFFGSDARPPYLDGALMQAEPRLRDDATALIGRARIQRAKIARIEKYADALVNNPPTGCFHARPFAVWLRMGVPMDIPPRASAIPPRAGPVRILHAPSSPEAKGTPRIRAAVASLKARGFALELVELVGQGNERVQDELARCDLVVDQAYSDTPMATLAAEAACHGRPAIVAGYYAAGIARDLPPELQPPTRYCHPDELEAAIAELASSPDARRKLGERAREFVASRFSPEAVAGMYLRLLRGQLPPDCFFDPVSSLRSVVPVGMEEASARRLMKGMHGDFQVRHNPGLERAMAEFAAGPSC